MAAVKINRIQSGIGALRNDGNWRLHFPNCFPAAEDGEGYGFHEEQTEAGCDTGNDQARSRIWAKATRLSGMSKAARAMAVRAGPE